MALQTRKDTSVCRSRGRCGRGVRKCPVPKGRESVRRRGECTFRAGSKGMAQYDRINTASLACVWMVLPSDARCELAESRQTQDPLADGEPAGRLGKDQDTARSRSLRRTARTMVFAGS